LSIVRHVIGHALGERWEFTRASFKLFPACHHTHAFLNAAIKLKQQHRVHAEDIEKLMMNAASVVRNRKQGAYRTAC
jgi:2-methylcitrate dehydratase PrpD